MIGLDEEGRRQLVVGMDEVAQGADEHPHGEGSIEAEGFITDKTHVGRLAVDHDLMLHEVLCNGLDVFVLSHEHGDVLCGNARLEQFRDGALDLVHGLLVIVLVVEQFDSGHANQLLAFGISLLNVLVSCLYVQGLLDDVLWRVMFVEFSYCRLCRLLSCQLEEHIIKRDDSRLRTVVGVEFHLFDFGMLVVREVLQQPPVSSSPPVDTLLHVTDDQRTGLMGNAVVDEYFEVVPLYCAGVLELVDHDILQRTADLLIDKRCIAAIDHVFDELLCVAEREVIVVGIDGIDLLCDASEQSELIEISEREVHRVLHPLSFLPQLFRFGDEWCDQFVEGLTFVGVFDGFFDELGPFLRIGLVDGSVCNITVVAFA